MKRLLAAIVTASTLLISIPVMGEDIDLSKYSVEQLQVLRNRVDEAINAAQNATQEADPSSNEIVTKKGDNNETAREVQQYLIRLGYLGGGADGVFGEGTESSVKKFQEAFKIEVNGVVDKKTYDILKKEAENAPEIISLTAIDLYNQFEDNSIGAEAQYKDKTLQVTGRISSIDTDFLGTPYVMLTADDYGWTGVQCYFSRNDKSALASLVNGQTVTIKGTKPSKSIVNVSLEDCTIVG